MAQEKALTTPKKRGPKSGSRGRPVNPERIRRIVEMRDVNEWSFLKIAQELGDDPPLTEQAIFLAYSKWREWVKKYPNPPASPPKGAR